jgi:SOS-response transcriptional repressor LexA
VFLSPRGQVKIDMEFFGQDASAQLFCAIVNDDGMSSDALRQGDTVLARQQFSAENGQLVVALLHDMTVIRRLNTTSGELIAGVRGFPSIPYAADSPQVKIIGIVVGMMRVVA